MNKILLSLLVIFIPVILYGQEKVEAPIWNVGDKWTWKKADGTRLHSQVVDVKEDLYVLRMGKDPDLYGYDKKTMNVKLLMKEGGGQFDFDKPWRKLLDFPMFVGKKWTDTTYGVPKRHLIRRRATGITFIYEFSIEGFEDITTSVGTFKCYKIRLKETDMTSDKSKWVYYWYSPEVKNWIKRERENASIPAPAWTENAELISYTLK